MKVGATFALCAILGIAWQAAPAASVEAALRSIEISEHSRTLDPSLVSYLGSEPRVAARAALAIGRTKNAAGTPALRAHLGAADPSVRAMCAYGLGLLTAADALDDERRLARGDRSSAVRYAAVDAIGRIVLRRDLASKYVAADLEAVMQSDGDAVVRAHAAAQFDVFGTAPFAAAYAGALERVVGNERSGDVRWHAMWALYRGFATVADAGFLRRALDDREELVRVEAVRAWGRRDDAPRETLVRLAASDPSWRVQLQAGETLRHLAHEPATEHLMTLPADIHLPPLAAANAGLATAGSRIAGRLVRATATSALQAPSSLTFGLPVAPFPGDARGLNAGFAPVHPRALILTTKGDVVVRLYPEWAPSTVANFLGLGARGYYDGNRWFRIVPDFVVQTGDAHDDPDGNAGYTIPAEENPVEQRSGIIAMGLDYEDGKALRDSAGTQYYLTLSPQLHLDRDFTVFGEVESGASVLAHLVESDRVLGVRRIADENGAS